MSKTRLDLLDCLPKGGVCAELGVFEGKFSEEIVKRTQPQKLYLVDLFEGSIVSGDQNGENLKRVDMANQFHVLKERLSVYAQVEVVKDCSWQWLQKRPQSHLDWLYIDTQHTYESTFNELQTAYHAVVSGGFICGHDYNEEQFPGVVLAVDEFCSRFHELKCEIFDGDALASYKIEVRK